MNELLDLLSFTAILNFYVPLQSP
ncbi:hypothetical protein XFF7767_820004 [Xanthomonas citri pv. fuscans]|nr:hypothetical protein XFF7767_820004 [Xanthomonas citri pv. fuscans]SOO08302.1 hypothetical protein XFF6970_20001 [Xanthomonas citri pv. fuscans]SOO45271.1 hypothetical protein XFF1815_720002 [Xanthomonas citri pv. fuscans]